MFLMIKIKLIDYIIICIGFLFFFLKIELFVKNLLDGVKIFILCIGLGFLM